MKFERAVLLAGMLALGLGLAQGQQGPGPQNPNAPRQMQPRGPQRGLEGNLMWTTANFLGVTPRELMLWADGQKTLADIVKQLGGDTAKLEAALVQARNAAIDQAVQAGRLTAQQASTYKASSAAVVKAFLAQKPNPNERGFGMGGPGGRGPGRGGFGR
ncbi:hypothetical protein [Allomeiothermus silvanus]|uniref:hypothetical protein n=1 Tax=Allomeiothermus silvanus TaxID=52022 RepID=UPI0023F40DEA|nr:hypothetical protein [Allomeiothermus silvanus]